MTRTNALLLSWSLLTGAALTGCAPAKTEPATVFSVPQGYKVEKVVGNLTYPTALTWDNTGKMYVAEAGGGLNPEQLAPSRILRVEAGKTTPVVTLSDQGVFASVVGLTFHNGAFYFTHRAQGDLTGAVSKATMDGAVTQVFKGIIDSQAEHQINDIKVGPDGRMYVAVGLAGNAGVIDASVAPWVMANPTLRPTACQDIVLTGRNFRTPDFRTKDNPDDMVMTGAYVPFGTETTPARSSKAPTNAAAPSWSSIPTTPKRPSPRMPGAFAI